MCVLERCEVSASVVGPRERIGLFYQNRDLIPGFQVQMKRNIFDAEIVRANLFAIGSIFQNNPFANSRNELYFIVLAIAGFVHHPHVVHARSVATDTIASRQAFLPEAISP